MKVYFVSAIDDSPVNLTIDHMFASLLKDLFNSQHQMIVFARNKPEARKVWQEHWYKTHDKNIPNQKPLVLELTDDYGPAILSTSIDQTLSIKLRKHLDKIEREARDALSYDKKLSILEELDIKDIESFLKAQEA